MRVRSRNTMCPNNLWELAKHQQRNIFDGIGKNLDELTIVNLEDSHVTEEYRYGVTHAPILPSVATLQNFTLEIDTEDLPEPVSNKIFNEVRYEQGYILDKLELLFCSDGDSSVFCDVVARLFSAGDDRETRAVDVGCIIFFAEKDGSCFSIAPWNIELTGIEGFNKCNFVVLSDFLANLWNGIQHKYKTQERMIWQEVQ